MYFGLKSIISTMCAAKEELNNGKLPRSQLLRMPILGRLKNDEEKKADPILCPEIRGGTLALRNSPRSIVSLLCFGTKGEKCPRMRTSEIEYQTLIKPEHVKVAIELIASDFMKRDILQTALGDADLTGEQNYILRDMRQSFGDGVSFGAFDSQTGDLVGVMLNAIRRKSDTKVEPQDNYPVTFRFLEFLEEGVDIFQRAQVDRYFEFYAISVSQNYGGRGIASMLIDKSEALAKQLGFTLIKSTLSSPVTQHLYRKKGFEVVKEYKIFDYQLDGKQLYTVGDPNFAVQLVTKFL